MLKTVQIRPYRPEDLPQVDALEARIQPYRPEDEPEVQAMFVRAGQAEKEHDPRWMMIPPPSVSRSISEDFEAFWVAEQEEQNTTRLVGIIGIQEFSPKEIIPSSHSLVQDWQSLGRVAELRRLRVMPEMRGQGLGIRLCQTVIEWARMQKYDLLVVNTTTPQLPALQLYRKLGFQEAGKSFIGKYELVWLELSL